MPGRGYGFQRKDATRRALYRNLCSAKGRSIRRAEPVVRSAVFRSDGAVEHGAESVTGAECVSEVLKYGGDWEMKGKSD